MSNATNLIQAFVDDKDIHIRVIDNNGYADDYVLDIDWVDY